MDSNQNPAHTVVGHQPSPGLAFSITNYVPEEINGSPLMIALLNWSKSHELCGVHTPEGCPQNIETICTSACAPKLYYK